MPGARRLYTLKEVSEKTKISLPTLQRYKKQHQDRIPSEGTGRRQRYPASALPVFKKIRAENMARRGRPRKAAKKTARKASRSAESNLLTLSEIGRRTGISYPTLLRYVRLHLDKIPHVGSGRTRRYRPAAVKVFADLRRQSRRGRAPGASGGRTATAANAALARRIKRLERSQHEISRQLKEVIRELKRPLRLTIHSNG